MTRLFFIGLWCHADKDGILEEDAEKLKLQILPYDKIGAEECLADLHPDFILRYKVGGKRYVFIKNFQKHQRPHPKEAKSELPPPFSTEAVTLHGKPLNYISSREITPSREGKGREGVFVSGNGKGSGEGKNKPDGVHPAGFSETATTTAPTLKAIPSGRMADRVTQEKAVREREKLAKWAKENGVK